MTDIIADAAKNITQGAVEHAPGEANKETMSLGQDSDTSSADYEDDMMIGKHEVPVRRALTHEEFKALLDYIQAPPRPITPEMRRMVANYKRIKARLAQAS